jgi:hypothetical protein
MSDGGSGASATLPGSGLPPDAGTQVGSGTGTANQTGGFPSGGLPSAQTPEERSAELDRVLSGSMVVFDSTMLEEQKRAQAARQGGAGQGTGSSQIPDIGSAAGTGDNDSGSAETGSLGEPGSGTDPEGKSSSVVGAPGNGRGATPEDIPSGDDDDVVARQLREAAEAETDPALRDKLWDEYRRYKSGSGN